MSKLKLGTIEDDKPVKLTFELPAAVHRNLVAYAEAIGRESGQQAIDAYLQTKTVWIDTVGKTANPFIIR